MNIYGLIGTPTYLVGGELHDGWALMQSERPDGEGWVATAEGRWVLPPQTPTMVKELKEEQDATTALLQQNAQRWLMAASTPGATRAAKVAAIEEEGVQIREAHKAAVAALKSKWVGP